MLLRSWCRARGVDELRQPCNADDEIGTQHYVLSGSEGNLALAHRKDSLNSYNNTPLPMGLEILHRENACGFDV